MLAPGGELGILDFSEPDGILGKLYAFYFRRMLPRIGRLLSGGSSAYTYLPASVGSFPAPPEMLAALERVGFRDVALDALHLWHRRPVFRPQASSL